MQFTYDAYRGLIQSLKQHNYSIASYRDWNNKGQCVILRHDIDNDIEKALTLAEIEREEGVKSTFFVLITSDFYNVFSAKNEELLQRISEYGHDIGLHFDEVRYPDIKKPEDARSYIIKEADLLSLVVKKTVDLVSMHRPSKMILDADLVIPNMINSYGQVYFKEFKYLSDSRRRWREPVDEIVTSQQYPRLHILTHAFWYNESELDIHDSVKRFINSGNMERYLNMETNITDLPSIMEKAEVRS